DSLNLNYEWDYDGDFGNAESYGGIKFLGSTPSLYINDLGESVFYSDSINYWVWQFRNQLDPVFFSPITDYQKYEKMSTGFNDYPGWENHPFMTDPVPNNRITLLTAGPYEELLPDSSLEVVFAVVCGSKYGDDPVEANTDRSKKEFMINARWAQVAYNGEDINGNGILDEGEDGNNNGVIDRYNLPAAPPSPRMALVPDMNKTTIYWDISSESAVDPVSKQEDFEGYRIYRARISNKSDAPSFKESFQLLAEYDRIDSIGYNIGLDPITMGEQFIAGIAIPVDTTIGGFDYSYRFVSDNLLDGWQYAFAVTAFDTGDPVNNLESLESSVLENATRVFAGPSANDANDRVTVFPNPYKALAIWDGKKQSGIRERERMIHFANLPARCTIRIYNIAGEKIRKIEHDGATYDGSDIAWYDSYTGDGAIFPGGIHSWDLVTDHDQAVATGLYIYTVENNKTGNIQRGKLMIVK
ncbi:MAG: hypothetical protein GY855_06390, partial [candidate division Zixibacteria bacterium]|nr:hypothetical protein [candidate division Zixibacteria bacterium]